MSTQLYRLVHQTARQRAQEAVRNAPDEWVVTVKPPARSLDQNSAQWPILQAFSDQLEWPVNGKKCKLTPEEFKDVLTAAFEQESVRLAMAFDGGGVVMLGQRTSKFGKKKFSEWLEFLKSAAVDRGVQLGEQD